MIVCITVDLKQTQITAQHLHDSLPSLSDKIGCLKDPCVYVIDHYHFMDFVSIILIALIAIITILFIKFLCELYRDRETFNRMLVTSHLLHHVYPYTGVTEYISGSY